jgi:HK97 family phage major capsid protein
MGAAVWGTEIAAPTADTSLAFGKREFKPNPATAEILLSKTLIRNAPGVEGIVRDEMAFIFGALLETAYLTGDGAGKPLGLFTASVDGIPTSRDVSTGNTATEMKFDGLMEAKYSIKQQYQAGCEWIFHRTGVKQIAKLKDSDGQYIWQPSVVMGTPDLLLSKPVNQSEYAPSTFTTGLYVGLYGDLKNYWICDSLALEIQVLMELYARTNQVDYIARIETDGAPIMSEAFARVKLG